MANKNVVVTARGRKLDLLALKAANAHVKPVGTRREKPEPKSKTPALDSLKPRLQTLSVPFPAARPKKEVVPVSKVNIESDASNSRSEFGKNVRSKNRESVKE